VELRQLELFVAVAEEQQFTRAARRCHIGQSSLSTSIRALERDLGTVLFIRTTRRVELSGAGLAFLVEARRTLEAASAARSAVQDMGATLRGSLSIGGIATPGIFDQAATLVEFRRRHPAVDIRYVRGASDVLIEDVRLGALNAAFISLTPRLPPGLQVRELVTEPLLVVCRPDHPLANHASIELEELADEDFVGAPPGSVGFDAIQRIFTATNTRSRIPFEMNDAATMLDFVAHGLGITLLQQTLARSRPNLRAIPLADPEATWTLAVITPAPNRVTPAASAFIDGLGT
jgi:DNA-binding transcriptional LysR family regulator